ncbi:MAG TPA: carboxypeptidase-like regulatory domain-containing protein [Terriglobia bacterium]|nr:carboxypeptidase-like regulatory domain-containing protein [Terriglobia bacterium]
MRKESHRSAPILTALTLLLLGGILLWGASAGWAKDKVPTSRIVSGVVIDPAENPIQGAMIELTDLQTKKVLDIYSQGGGQYQFTNLRFDHDYTVKATYKNSSSEVRQVSSIDTRWHMVLNLTIPNPNK